MINTENELIAASMAIGSISETAAWYTAGLAERIEATGKHVHQLTIGELMALEHEHHEYHRKQQGLTVTEGVELANTPEHLPDSAVHEAQEKRVTAQQKRLEKNIINKGVTA